MSSKPALRAAARALRATLVMQDFPAAVARHAEALLPRAGLVVGGYHALAEEADPVLLLQRLRSLGCVIAFPRVTGKDKPLSFHAIPPTAIGETAALLPGAYGIHEPSADWPLVTPELLLVPLLAFDAAGHRLGYGGGYYDRTLAALPRVHAFGIAYAGQEMASLPREAHDMALAGIVSEQGIRHFR